MTIRSMVVFAGSAWQLCAVVNGVQFLKSAGVAVGVEVVAQGTAAVTKRFSQGRL